MDVRGEKNSVVGKLRVRGEGFDLVGARLSFERLFGANGFLPDGLLPGALLCIKKISDPQPHTLRLSYADWRFAEAWRKRVAREIENFYRRAFRPVRETVPAQAESVLFADTAELLACLAGDFCRGKLAENWWWRGLFPDLGSAQSVAKIWLDAAEFVPMAFQILSKTGDAVRFVQKLQPAETQDLLRRIVKTFALQKLEAALFEPFETKAKFDSEKFSKFVGSVNLFWSPEPAVLTSGKSVLSGLMAEINAANLSSRQQILLAAALLLGRSPKIAASAEFAERVKYYRLKEEFGKKTTAGKREEFSERKPIFERKIETLQAPIRKLRDKSETRIVEPKAAKTEVRFFTEKDDQKRGTASESSAEELKKSPKVGESPPVETQKAKRFDERPAKIEFETAKPEKRVQKSDPKKGAKAEQITKPADAKTGFEKYFEDFETAMEYSFQTRLGGVFYLLNLGLYLELYRDFTESLTTEIDLNIWDFVALLGVEFLGEPIKRDAVWDFLKTVAECDGDDEFGQEFDQSQDWRMPIAWLETFPKNQKWFWTKTKKRLIIRHWAGFNVVDAAVQNSAQTHLKAELQKYQEYFAGIEKSGKKSQIKSQIKSQKWSKNLAEYLEKRLFQALGLNTADELKAVLFERRATVSMSATHLDITFSLADLPFEVRVAGIDRDPGWIPAVGKFVYFHFV